MKNSNLSQKYFFLFWQPRKDLFKKISQTKYGNQFLIVINYIIWVFFFFISYLLIKQDTNVFWQLFSATIISEIIEKILKTKSFWKRPLHINHNVLPNGLLKSWYQKGSFPSGHAIKATFFFILLLHAGILISPFYFLIVALPLVLIRIILGLHYPIDVLGGIIIGLIIGLLIKQIQFPDFMINFIQPIFNFIFLLK
jgi:membrane-associated phospholipid phosphatase